MPAWSLQGLVFHLENRAKEYDLRAERGREEFRSTHLAQTAHWPGMRRMPAPAQKLCVQELAEGILRLEGSKEVRPLGDAVQCDCLLYRKYQLPCRHLWQCEYVFGGVLKEDYWKEAGSMFVEFGFDIYEGLEAEYLQLNDDEEELEAPQARRLKVSFLLFTLFCS